MEAPGNLPVVLVIDDDPDMRDTYSRELRAGGFRVAVASSGAEGLSFAGSGRCALAVVDQQLGDMLGTEMMRRLQGAGQRLPWVLISGWMSLDDEAAARRLGALDVIDLPLWAAELTARVTGTWRRINGEGVAAKASPQAANSTVFEARPDAGSNAKRLAVALFKAASSCTDDPRTMALFAAPTGMSASGISQLCRALGISPHDARDFTRVLWANREAGKRRSDVEPWLSAADPTVRYLLRRGGYATLLHAKPVPTGQLLDQQTFIRADPPVVRTLRHLVAPR